MMATTLLHQPTRSSSGAWLTRNLCRRSGRIGPLQNACFLLGLLSTTWFGWRTSCSDENSLIATFAASVNMSKNRRHTTSSNADTQLEFGIWSRFSLVFMTWTFWSGVTWTQLNIGGASAWPGRRSPKGHSSPSCYSFRVKYGRKRTQGWSYCRWGSKKSVICGISLEQSIWVIQCCENDVFVIRPLITNSKPSSSMKMKNLLLSLKNKYWCELFFPSRNVLEQ